MTLIGDHACKKCPLHADAMTVCVAPRGSLQADILVVGEAPGPQEDREGFAFVGPSGNELDKLLKEAGVDPKRVRRTNTVRCIPWLHPDTYQGMRPPSAEESAACLPYLHDEIRQTKPKVLLLLGNSALQALTRTNTKIGKERGRKLIVTIPAGEGVPAIEMTAVATYHPAYLLRGTDRVRPQVVSDMSLVARIADGTEVAKKGDYGILNSLGEVSNYVDEVLAAWKKEGSEYFRLAVDAETSHARGWGKKFVPKPLQPDSRIVTLQFSHKNGFGRMIPVCHPGGAFNNPEAMRKLRIELKRLLESGIPVVNQNIKYDYQFLYAKLGVRIANVYADPMLMNHHLSGGSLPGNLDFLESYYLKVTGFKHLLEEAMDEIIAVRKVQNKQRKKEGLPPLPALLEDVPLQRIVTYGCADVDFARQLAILLEHELKAGDRWSSFLTLYMETFEPITWMEIRGAHVDLERVERMRLAAEARLSALHSEIEQTDFWSVAAEQLKKPNKKRHRTRKGVQTVVEDQPEFVVPPLNLNSTPQMHHLLFKTMKLPPAKTLDPGAKKDTSADKKVLTAAVNWASRHGLEDHLTVLKPLVEQRKLGTEYKNHFSQMASWVFDRGEVRPTLTAPWEYRDSAFCVHTSYKQEGTGTGRLSSSEPPLHGTPRKSETKRCYDSRFDPGLIVCADQSQMEFRVMAVCSGDERLIAAYWLGVDIHRYIASLIFQVPLEEVTSEQRQMAKTVGFGIIYGRTAVGIAKGGMNVTEDYAQSVIDRMFEEFPGIRRYVKQQQRFAKKHGYCVSMLGRVRPIPELSLGRVAKSGGNYTRVFRDKLEKKAFNHGMNVAVNTPIQGDASDITAHGIARVHRRLISDQMHGVLFGYVHDSCIGDFPVSEVIRAVDIMKFELADGNRGDFPWFKVPMVVEVSVGTSWGSAVVADLRQEDGRSILKLVGPVKDVFAVSEIFEAHSAGTIVQWSEAFDKKEKAKIATAELVAA